MPRDSIKTAKLIYSIAFGLMSIGLAFILILQVMDIYLNGGATPFTVDNINAHLSSVIVYACVYLALVIVGFILYGYYPEKPRIIKTDVFYTHRILDSRLLDKTISNDTYIKNERLITVVRFICALCVLISTVFCALYLLDEANFTNADQNQEVLRATLYLLPFVVVSFALFIGASFYERSIITTQISNSKDVLQDTTLEGERLPGLRRIRYSIDRFFDDARSILSMRIAVFAIGLTLLILGLALGGSAGVLSKAITICRQCIGLG